MEATRQSQSRPRVDTARCAGPPSTNLKSQISDFKSPVSHGFILLETLVAMVVLSIGVVAVNRALHEALIARAQARDYTHARFMLEQLMSELEMQPLLVEGTASGNFGKAHPRFGWDRRVDKVTLPPPQLPGTVTQQMRQKFVPPVTYLAQVTVTVRWTRAGRQFAETAQTIVSDSRLYVPTPPQTG